MTDGNGVVGLGNTEEGSEPVIRIAAGETCEDPFPSLVERRDKLILQAFEKSTRRHQLFRTKVFDRAPREPKFVLPGFPRIGVLGEFGPQCFSMSFATSQHGLPRSRGDLRSRALDEILGQRWLNR